MDISQVLLTALQAADDDYLIGLTNKGTVNRAKKDLSASPPSRCEPEGETVKVTVGDAVCTIAVPLGASKCTCPSSSLCRHRVSAILWLRENSSSQAEEKTVLPEFQQLRRYPADKLLRELGPSRCRRIAQRVQAGEGPGIAVSSVISVDLPWIPATVRLLEPMEHSTCSCHSKKWCVHKSEALAFWLLRENILEVQCFLAQKESNWDLPEIHAVAGVVESTLLELMAVGVSRVEPGVRTTLERLASQCHTARLPDLERALHRVQGELGACFARSATYRDRALLQKITRACRLASLLQTATEENISCLAGKFRDQYDAVGNLKLYLLGVRRILGHGAYTGKIYYFLDREDFSFYTFRHMRPRNAQGASGKKAGDPAPWNLPCTLTQAWNQAMDLNGARVNAYGVLSASDQCAATLQGKMHPRKVVPESLLVRDFEALIPLSDGANGECLALIAPKAYRRQPFDSVRQVYSMVLLDEHGRDLWLEVRYSWEESGVVSMLEALEQNAVPSPEPPVFFGSVYREGDKIKFYPIEYFENWSGKNDTAAGRAGAGPF